MSVAAGIATYASIPCSHHILQTIEIERNPNLRPAAVPSIWNCSVAVYPLLSAKSQTWKAHDVLARAMPFQRDLAEAPHEQREKIVHIQGHTDLQFATGITKLLHKKQSNKAEWRIPLLIFFAFCENLEFWLWFQPKFSFLMQYTLAFAAADFTVDNDDQNSEILIILRTILFYNLEVGLLRPSSLVFLTKRLEITISPRYKSCSPRLRSHSRKGNLTIKPWRKRWPRLCV